MSPERAAIIDAMMMGGGGPRTSVYSPPPLKQQPDYPPVQGESWFERQRREKAEFEDERIRRLQEGLSQ